MDNNEIRKANRKALPKFIGIMVITLLLSGTAGYYSGKYGLNSLAGSLKSAGAYFGTYIAPWAMLILAVLLPVICVPIYRGAKKLVSAWDGEDEDVSEEIDRKLSIVTWITSTALILGFFLIAASYSGGAAMFDDEKMVPRFFMSIGAFVVIMLEALITQQKCVDTAKRTNPEKTASIYDTRFQKKWMDSCDEAEKVMIGKCAFQAYKATDIVCTVLAVVLAICALEFEIGFLPSAVVCLIWIVNQSVYCKEALRYSKAGNKIS